MIAYCTYYFFQAAFSTYYFFKAAFLMYFCQAPYFNAIQGDKYSQIEKAPECTNQIDLYA